MKFKFIFILFNILIIFSFLMIVILPIIVFDSEYAALFWKGKWYFSLVFIAVIAGLNIYFINNWKLFSYLENENWPGLIDYLEDQIYNKKKISKRRVLLLINTYLLHSGIEKLEKLAVVIKETSLCGLGKTAPNPVVNTICHFYNEYEAYVKHKRRRKASSNARKKIKQ